jgi:hypothetical protein
LKFPKRAVQAGVGCKQKTLTRSIEITTLVFSGLSELPPAPELHGECLTMVMYRSRAIAAMVPVETMMFAPCIRYTQKQFADYIQKVQYYSVASKW